MNEHVKIVFMRETEMSRVDAELERRGVIQAEFAAKIGESPQTINNWRQRGGSIPGNKRPKVAEFFGWSIDKLQTGRDAIVRSDKQREQSPINVQHLTEILEIVEDRVTRRFDVPKKDIAQLIANLYDRMPESGGLPHAVVMQFVRPLEERFEGHEFGVERSAKRPDRRRFKKR